MTLLKKPTLTKSSNSARTMFAVGVSNLKTSLRQWWRHPAIQRWVAPKSVKMQHHQRKIPESRL